MPMSLASRRLIDYINDDAVYPALLAEAKLHHRDENITFLKTFELYRNQHVSGGSMERISTAKTQMVNALRRELVNVDSGRAQEAINAAQNDPLMHRDDIFNEVAIEIANQYSGAQNNETAFLNAVNNPDDHPQIRDLLRSAQDRLQAWENEPDPGIEGPGIEGPGIEGPGIEGPGIEGPGEVR